MAVVTLREEENSLSVGDWVGGAFLSTLVCRLIVQITEDRGRVEDGEFDI